VSRRTEHPSCRSTASPGCSTGRWRGRAPKRSISRSCRSAPDRGICRRDAGGPCRSGRHPNRPLGRLDGYGGDAHRAAARACLVALLVPDEQAAVLSPETAAVVASQRRASPLASAARRIARRQPAGGIPAATWHRGTGQRVARLRGACQHADSQPGTRARWRARVGSERGVDAGAGQTPRCGAGDLLREQLAKYGRELAASRKTIHARRRPTVADSRGSPIPLEREDRIIRTSNSRHRHLYASNDSIRSRRTSWWP
jgi:hypothetical protein